MHYHCRPANSSIRMGDIRCVNDVQIMLDEQNFPREITTILSTVRKGGGFYQVGGVCSVHSTLTVLMCEAKCSCWYIAGT